MPGEVNCVVINGDLGDEVYIKWGHLSEQKLWPRRAMIESFIGCQLTKLSSHEFGVSLNFTNGDGLMFSTIEIGDNNRRILWWGPDR